MILFVCTHNAGRSVMAEAFARAAGLDALSAGTEPADAPHSAVLEAMSEVGIDVSRHRGTLLTDELIEKAEIVVTLCAVDAAACPAISSARVEHWPFPDPGGASIQQTRLIRDEIRARVEALSG